MSCGSLPYPFLKIEKSVLSLKKKNCVHLWDRFPIQNAVLIVSRRKTPKSFPVVPFFLILDKMFIKVPQFYKTSPALKSFWLRACTSTLLFFISGPILDNYSVICTVTL